jgi:1,4-alpha-glucan branching enzyme
MRPLLFVLALSACGETTPAPSDGGSSSDGSVSPGSVDLASAPTTALGANVEAGGVAFRLWAPHAIGARVSGSFAGSPVTMSAAAGGLFEAHVAGAKAGDHYAFSLDQADGDPLVRTDPYCRQLADDGCVVSDPSAYSWQSPGFARPSRDKSVVYELHVGSFAVEAGAEHGTFASLTQALEGLAELGVDVIELMPVQSFGGGPAGWGYNPQLYFAPKPSYGTTDELRAMIDRAHGLGIAVWLDSVVNHMDGWTKAPLRCFDGDCDSGGSGIYFFPQGDYAATPWGPRPNYPEPQVTRMLTDAAIAFVDELHGDGFRWDSVSNIRALDGNGSTPGGKELMVSINDALHARGAMSVAEDLKGYGAITQPTTDGGFGFDAQWDGFGWSVVGELTKASDTDRDLGNLVNALTGTSGGDPFGRLLFLENHDTVGNGGARLPVKIDGADPGGLPARQRAMLGAVLLLTTPGVPMIFMGEESLATQGFGGTPAPLQAPTADGLGVRTLYKDLIRLRRNLDGNTGGLADRQVEIVHRNDAGKALAYRRHGASGQDVLVLLNLKNKAYAEYDIGVDDPGPWTIRVNTTHSRYGSGLADGQTGTVTAHAGDKDGKPYVLPLTLGAYGAIVLSR